MVAAVVTFLLVGGSAVIVGTVVYRAARGSQARAAHARDPDQDDYEEHTAWMRRLHDDGASAVEYGLLIAAVAVVIVGVAFGLGNVVKNAFKATSSTIQQCSPDPTPCNQPTP